MQDLKDLGRIHEAAHHLMDALRTDDMLISYLEAGISDMELPRFPLLGVTEPLIHMQSVRSSVPVVVNDSQAGREAYAALIVNQLMNCISEQLKEIKFFTLS